MKNLYSIAAMASKDGVTKLKLAKDEKFAAKNFVGFTVISTTKLPKPMTKDEAKVFLASGAVAEKKLSPEEALAKVPMRDAKGHFIKKEVRLEMAKQYM